MGWSRPGSSLYDLAATPAALHGALAATVAKRAQVDLMDGAFVPNTTVQAHDLVGLKPPLALELHLMVQDPLAAMNAIGKRASMFLVHVETVGQGTGVDGKASVAELRARALDARRVLYGNRRNDAKGVAAHTRQGEQIGLDAGTAAAVRAGDGQNPAVDAGCLMCVFHFSVP